MRVAIKLVAWTAAVTIPGCATRGPLTESHSGVQAAAGDRCASGALQDGGCDVHEVSLAELLTAPEKFHQKKVAVAGHLTLGFERNRLCERIGAGNCLWVADGRLEKPAFRKGWAVVEGTFNRENRGHLGCCAGAIERISRITPRSR
jgi:hypothetical protein